MLAWIIIIITVIVLLYRAYHKIKNPFWSRMPVVHDYGVTRFFARPGYIQEGDAVPDQWWDPNKVSVFKFENLSIERRKEFCSFIRDHYLNTEKISYKPSDDKLLSLFSNTACYISFLNDNFSGDPGDTRTGGVISSRPLTLFLPDSKLVLNYCDLLCIRPDLRQRGLSPYLIQTQTYQVRKKDMNACIFKRENNARMSIIPLVEFDVLGFDCSELELHLNYETRTKIIAIDKSNFYKIKDLFKQKVKPLFKCLIVPTIDQLLNLVTAKILMIFVFVVGDKITGLYLFRNGSVVINGKATVELISSVNLGCKDKNEFVLGFLSAYRDLLKQFPVLSIDCISHNKDIVAYLLPKHRPFLQTKSSFYLYNYYYPTFDDESCFIID